MVYALIVALGFLAGWLVNVVADTTPLRLSWRVNWLNPLKALATYSTTADQPANSAHRLRYWAVWLTATMLGWLAYQRIGMTTEGLILALEAWFFLAIAVIDLEHRKVLNQMLLVALPLILVFNLVIGFPGLISAVLGALAGLGCFLLLALVKPGSMGMGDVKLAGLIGMAAGLPGVIIAILVGIYAGGLVALILLVRNRFRSGQTMAYAPYLALGAWVALYFGADLWQIYLE
jgi:prepilin signal peptidase PulO-like enzyme (type II secretory pathway)